MDKNKEKTLKRSRRRAKIRVKIMGVEARPRLSVHKSNRNFYLQLIDDVSGKTLVSAHSREIKPDKGDVGKKDGKATDKAGKIGFELGRLLARKAKEKKIECVVFDRGGYKYHGGIKAIAEGAREEGLKL